MLLMFFQIGWFTIPAPIITGSIAFGDKTVLITAFINCSKNPSSNDNLKVGSSSTTGYIIPRASFISFTSEVSSKNFKLSNAVNTASTFNGTLTLSHSSNSITPNFMSEVIWSIILKSTSLNS